MATKPHAQVRISYTKSGLDINEYHWWERFHLEGADITATDGISVTVGPVWQFSTAAREWRVYLPVVLRMN